jgi:negative regulator of flagellin synthesis FlgM
MKIGPSTEKPAPKPATTGAPSVSDTARNPANTAAAGATGSVAPPPAADASAKIALSSTAANLLSTGVDAEFNAEKVARIAAAIDNGTFKINPEAIADKLISNAQEVLSQGKP